MAALANQVEVDITQQGAGGEAGTRPTLRAARWRPTRAGYLDPSCVAMVTWEYPPLVVGGISAHAGGLARALARAGHEVVVLTLHHPDVPDDEEVDGVRVLRAAAELPWLPDDQFVARMAGANHHLVALIAR